LEAARLADEWESLFSAELKLAAEQLAKPASMITVDHYCQAVPTAISAVLRAVEAATIGVTHARRRTA